MSGRVTKVIRGARAAAVAGALALGIGGLVVQGGVADAANGHAHSPAAALTAARATSRKTGDGGLPTVGNARNLSKQPVVHADRGKPPTKLLTKNLVVGTGATATRTSTVDVKYVGANYKTGKDFTSVTWAEGEPTSFSLKSGVITGFAEGIAGMKVGGRREIVIPPKLGYGDEADPPIKANETLVFVVDLEGVSS